MLKNSSTVWNDEKLQMNAGKKESLIRIFNLLKRDVRGDGNDVGHRLYLMRKICRELGDDEGVEWLDENEDDITEDSRNIYYFPGHNYNLNYTPTMPICPEIMKEYNYAFTH